MAIKANGEVVVTSPRFVPHFQIEKFVRENSDWIEKTRARLALKSLANTEDTVVIFGKKYTKKVEYSSSSAIGIHIQKNFLVLNPLSPEQINWDKEHTTQLNRFLKTTASNYIVPRTHQLGKKMKISFAQISLKEQATRWGSCSSQGNLNFNWRLVHFEPAVIDYVIIHELSHRTHMNHSKKFWELVRAFDPEFTVHRGVLKRTSIGLD